MSHGNGIVMCNLCGREFNKYIRKEKEKLTPNPDLKRLHGLEITRSWNYTPMLKFVDVNKTPDNKHICTNCIFDIVKVFGEQ